MTHNPATHVVIYRCDLNTAAFWLGQLARWLDDPNHASQFSWDLFGVPEDYQPPLTVALNHVAQPLLDALLVGPNQTVNPGPNELDTSRNQSLAGTCLLHPPRQAVQYWTRHNPDTLC